MERKAWTLKIYFLSFNDFLRTFYKDSYIVQRREQDERKTSTSLNEADIKVSQGDRNFTAGYFEQSVIESARMLNDDIQIRGHKSKSISRIPKPKKNMFKNVGRVDNYSEEKINKFKKTRQECDKIGEKDNVMEGTFRKENSQQLLLENELEPSYGNISEEFPHNANFVSNDISLYENCENSTQKELIPRLERIVKGRCHYKCKNLVKVTN